MIILQVINSLSAGGAESFAVNLAVAQARAGHKVFLYTYSGTLDSKGKKLREKLERENIGYISSNISNNFLKIFVPFFLGYLLKRINPDVTHSHLEQSDFFTALAKKFFFGRKFLFIRTIHSVYATTKIPNFIHRWTSTQTDLDVACGPSVFEEYPFFSRKKVLLNNGVDLHNLIPNKDVNQVREEIGVKSDEILLLNIGSFSIRNGVLPKAQDIIIDALRYCKDNINYKVLFLGDGEKIDFLRSIAHEYGLSERCIFLGMVPSVTNYIRASDAIIMPSRFEGLSIGCIEAVCLNRPVIVSDINAFRPFNKTSTIFVPPENVELLAEAMYKFRLKRDFFSRESEANGDIYRQVFDINSVAKNYVEFYSSLKQ